MNGVVCTAASGPHQALFDVTGPTMQCYAERFGYDFAAVHDRLAPGRPASWDKIVFLHSLVEKYDMIFWVDADAAVRPDTPDVAGLLRPGRFLYVVEHHLGRARVPNAGVMLLRGGATSRRLLERIWDQREFIHDPWWDNGALLRLLGYRRAPVLRPVVPTFWRAGTAFIDGAWNSIPLDPAPHPYVVHVPGVPLDERLERLRAAA